MELFSFGNVTIGFLVCGIVVGVLCLINYVLNFLLGFLLNSGHPNAPKFNFKNYVVSVVSFILKPLLYTPIGKHNVKKWGSGFAVFKRTDSDFDDWYYAKDGASFYKSESIKNNCLFTTREEAEDFASKTGSFSPLRLLLLLFTPVAIDFIILMASKQFTITVCVVGFVFISLGIRWLAGKLYENTAKTDGHETRITALETVKGNKND